MDVSFLTSGALSRAHFTLVHKVESANTLEEADSYIWAEVESIRRRFSKRTVSSSQCKEYLLLLLYCWTSNAWGPLEENMFNFALPHAVTLAESGRSLKERRVGYLFNSLMLPPGHELNLMLVNTIRKDLESPETARICLALDYLIRAPSHDVIPAIQTHLEDLLLHTSSQVRQKALLAARALATSDPDLLVRFTPIIKKRLRDRDPSVSHAAVLACSSLLTLGSFDDAGSVALLLDLLESSTSEYPILRLQILSLLTDLIRKNIPTSTQLDTCLKAILNVLNDSVSPSSASTSGLETIIQCFRTISAFKSDILRSQFSAMPSTHPVLHIRYLLASYEPNQQYTFLSCLMELDPTLWIGGMDSGETILSEPEVHRILSLLESKDPAIRTMAGKLLYRADSDVFEQYYKGLLSSQRADSSSKPRSENREYSIERLLEMASISSVEGQQYSMHIREIMGIADPPAPRVSNQPKGKGKGVAKNSPPILEGAVEAILLHLRAESTTFRGEFANHLFTTLISSNADIGRTTLLIVAAVACEYGEISNVSAVDLLQELARHLNHSSPAIQEALLLSMLRITAACHTAPRDILDRIEQLESQAGRHIRMRCRQFLEHTADPTKLSNLKRLTTSAKSSSLPDFLMAIEHPQDRSIPERSASVASTSTASSHSGHSSTSDHLRYEAYASPKPTPKRRERRRSTATSSTSRSSSSPPSWTREVDDEALSKTVTAGELALAGDVAFLAVDNSDSTPRPGEKLSKLDIGSDQINLIGLDSPFHAEPMSSRSASEASDLSPRVTAPTMAEFQQLWDSLSSPQTTGRGWSEQTPNEVMQKLKEVGQGFELIVEDESLLHDQDPFENGTDPDILLLGTVRGVRVAVRLKRAESGTCLWVLRCANKQARAEVVHILEGD